MTQQTPLRTRHAAILAGGLAFAGAASANLVVNGGFESGTFNGAN